MLNKLYRGCLVLVFFISFPVVILILALNRLAEEYVDLLLREYDRMR